MCRKFHFLLCILRFNQHWLTMSCKSVTLLGLDRFYTFAVMCIYLVYIENVSKINLAKCTCHYFDFYNVNLLHFLIRKDIGRQS